jgi:hypothetical protein
MAFRLRVGVLDAAAAAVVLIAIVMPPRSPHVMPLFPKPAIASAIAEREARLASDPGDGVAAEELADILVDTGHDDWALRVAGTSAAREGSPTRWRALRAVSTTHAERVEIQQAFEYARKALDACHRVPASCPPHEEVRLSLYFEQLDAGIRSGIDPRTDPAAFRAALNRAIPWVTIRTKQ